jgi:lipopolysaccharide transport system ATP-binding protein
VVHDSRITTSTLGSRRSDIVVIDDFYPNLTTGFRVAEYNHYLRAFPDLLIASTIGDFKERHAVFGKLYPDLRSRVVSFDPELLSHAKLCYLNFLNNAHYHVEYLEAAALPFLFTLYPGGGFELHSDETDLKLKRVLRSPMLRAVISTQSITTQVLRDLRCPVEVYELYGATINPTYLRSSDMRSRNALNDRSPKPNICFVAHKYDLKGRTKGYPTFIELAAKLSNRLSGAAFSVVGNYGPDDIDIPGPLKQEMQFKGLLPTSQLRDFLFTQDLMISPNQPYTVSGSMFDGFPTASCVEASLCGVAIVCSDELNLNHFYNSDEMIVCAPAASAILEVIEPLLANPSLTAQIGERGRKKSLLLFSAEAQLLPRTRILRDILAAGEGFPA